MRIISMATGEHEECPRDTLEDEAITDVRRQLSFAMGNCLVPVRDCPEFSYMATTNPDGALLVTIARQLEKIAFFVIAYDINSADDLWRDMLASVREIERPPPEAPWCAFHLSDGEARDWLMGFMKHVAWAWLPTRDSSYFSATK